MSRPRAPLRGWHRGRRRVRERRSAKLREPLRPARTRSRQARRRRRAGTATNQRRRRRALQPICLRRISVDHRTAPRRRRSPTLISAGKKAAPSRHELRTSCARRRPRRRRHDDVLHRGAKTKEAHKSTPCRCQTMWLQREQADRNVPAMPT